MDNIKNFGPNLRAEIKKKGYKTYQKAADAFGISLSYLNQLMRNEREPSLELLKTITDELGVSTSFLIGDQPKHVNPLHSGTPDRAQRILELQSKLLSMPDEAFETVEMTVNNLHEMSQNEARKSVRKT